MSAPIRPFSRLSREPRPQVRLRPRGGFSLVELLVVIGIIALLIAILLPAVSRAIQQSRGVQCLSNLRQMATAAQAYVAANAGSFPASHYYITDSSGATYTYDWDYAYVADSSGMVLQST